MIDIETINKTAQEIYNTCVSLYHESKWSLTPSLNIIISTHKMKHGRVIAQNSTDYSCIIELHRGYLGSTHTEALKYTLAHEMTHCIVGLERNHDRLFKRVFETILFSLGINESLAEDQLQEIAETADYKYTVYAILEDDTKLLIGGAHKCTKKYRDYPNNGESHVISSKEHKNKKVIKYEFIQNH